MTTPYPTLSDLAGRLAGIVDPTGTHPNGIPVIGPGSNVVAFPAILLAPDDDTIEQSKLIRTWIEVKVLLSRGNQTAAYAHLESAYRATLDRLAGSPFTISGPFRFDVGGPPDDPPFMARVIPVSFISYGLCPTPPPFHNAGAPLHTVENLEDDPDPDPDPEPTEET